MTKGAEQIARALGGAARAGRGWIARCCCHRDENPGLSLCDGDDGMLLVKCFMNRDPCDILVERRLASWPDGAPQDRPIALEGLLP